MHSDLVNFFGTPLYAQGVPDSFNRKSYDKLWCG